jgi:ATP-dependent DNA helicase RecG
MGKISSDFIRWQTTKEGQFFDRKSAFDRSGRQFKHRKAKDIAWDIVETLSAMANADGGELVIGLENNGTLSGVPHAEDKVRLLMGVPKDRNYVEPPLPCKASEYITPEDKKLLHFEVDWSPNVHQLSDGRYLLRVGDSNHPFDSNKIKALKDAKAQGLFERTFPAAARVEDFDLDLIDSLAPKAWPDLEPMAILRRHGLVESRNGQTVPTLASLLLFGKAPGKWHERCGIDFVRWEGTERKHGIELNITKRIRIEVPLSVLIEKAFEAIKPFIRERQQLHDLFFTERLEYPTFAWQEAIVNAVAHRDYSIRGMSIEVWMFDDRMEIRSPGLPPSPVTLEALVRKENLHCSRNPLIVRVLTELGYMRELGEGIPRMFDEMDRAGCYPPKLEIVGGVSFQVTLRNEPIYNRATIEWLQKFKKVDLTGDQKRMLAYAHAHGGRFTSREYRKLIETEIYGAAGAIKDMIRKGVTRSTGKGSRVYVVQEPLDAPMELPTELVRLFPILQRTRCIKNEDVRKILSVARNTAFRMLKEWTENGWLKKTGYKRGSAYEPGERFMHHPQNVPDNNEAGA